MPWQRCQSHLIENAPAFVPKATMKKAVVASLRAVFDATDRTEAERPLGTAVKKYRATAPQAGRVAGDGYVAGAGGLRPADVAREAVADDQHAGAAEQGVKAADESRRAVPQRGVGAAARDRRGDGDQRGLGDERRYLTAEPE